MKMNKSLQNKFVKWLILFSFGLELTPFLRRKQDVMAGIKKNPSKCITWYLIPIIYH